LKLAPIDAAALDSQSKSIAMAGQHARLVDFTSDAVLVSDKFKKRTVAAILPDGPRTWFFKLSGDEPSVAVARPSFLEFLKSVRLKSS
jgi:hypothetical protein